MSEQAHGPQRTWPREPQFPQDLFRGNADYYARYRPAYPRDLLDDLMRRAEITGDGRMLDLACGTGEIALPMAPHFREVQAVDQEPEMIERGRAKAAGAGVENVTWTVGRAEDLQIPPASLELITIGNAFHRLHRRAIGRHALTWLRPGGRVAVLNGAGLWSGERQWQHAAIEVIQKWKAVNTGPTGPTGDADQPHETHHEALAAAGFERIEEHEFPTPQTWTLENFVGYIYSTGAASKKVFGDAVQAFEAELRRAILAHEPSGGFHETITFHYILARRPTTRAGV